MSPNHFGSFFRNERRRRNMTLADQSEQMKITSLKLSRIENGEEKLLPDHFYAVCDFFEISSGEMNILFKKCFDDSNVVLFKPVPKMKLYQLTINQIKALRIEGELENEV